MSVALRMLALLLLQAVMLVAVASAQGTPQSLSLDSALRMFLERNPSVEVARQQIEEARGRIDQAGRPHNPTLNFSQEGFPLGRSETGYDDQEFLFWASQRLELGGKRSRRRQEAVRGLEVQEAELNDWLRRGRARVARAFVRVHHLQAQQRMAAALLGRYSQLNRIHQQRLQEGDVSGLSHLKIEAEEIRYRAALAQAETALGRAWSELASWLNWPGASLPRLQAPPVLKAPLDSLDGLRQKALQTRPDLEAARARLLQARAGLALQQAEGVPDLTLGGGFKRDFGQNSFYVGLQLPLPLFDRNQGAVAAAGARLEASRKDLEWLQIRIRREVEEAWRRLELQREAAQRLGQTVGGKLERIVEVTQLSYAEGEADLLELLDAMRVELEASLGLQELIMQAHLSRIDLEAAVGTRID